MDWEAAERWFYRIQQYQANPAVLQTWDPDMQVLWDRLCADGMPLQMPPPLNLERLTDRILLRDQLLRRLGSLRLVQRPMEFKLQAQPFQFGWHMYANPDSHVLRKACRAWDRDHRLHADPAHVNAAHPDSWAKWERRRWAPFWSLFPVWLEKQRTQSIIEKSRFVPR